MLRILIITGLLFLMISPVTLSAMPMQAFEGQELREQIRAIRVLRRCEAEAGELLELCLQTVLVEEALTDDELSEDIEVCDDAYQRALTKCREYGVKPRSVLRVR